MTALDALLPVYRIDCSECSTSFHVLEKPGTGTCYFSACPNPRCNAKNSLSDTPIRNADNLK